MQHLPHHIRRKLLHLSRGEAEEVPVYDVSPLPVETKAEETDTSFAHVPHDLKSRMAAFEKKYIRHVIEKNGNNVSRAARELGISRQSLQYRLRKYGMGFTLDN